MSLQNGQPFPTITASRLEGGEMALPAGLAPGWSVVLFYRGVW